LPSERGVWVMVSAFQSIEIENARTPDWLSAPTTSPELVAGL